MEKAFEILGDIRDVIMSTSLNDIPQGRMISIFHYDEGGLYFVTCSTKPFYKELKANSNLSMAGMNEERIQVRLVGKADQIVGEKLDQFLMENPKCEGMFETEKKDGQFVLFYVSRGKGEIFDISGREARKVRSRFAFGGETVNEAGCYINDNCTSCGACTNVCHLGCIEEGEPYKINAKYCDECGMCYKACPVGAIDLPKGM